MKITVWSLSPLIATKNNVKSIEKIFSRNRREPIIQKNSTFILGTRKFIGLIELNFIVLVMLGYFISIA